MLVTDAQVHLWAAPSPERPWPPGGEGRAHRSVPLGAEEMVGLMDAAAVDRAVIVPPSWEGDRNDVALAAVRDHPGRFAVMGRLSLAGALPDLGRWREQPGMLGVRLTFHLPEYKHQLADGTCDRLFAAAAEADLPVMVFAPGQTEELGRVARRLPGVRLVVDHLNLGLGVHDGEIGEWLAPLYRLAALPNVSVKVSALPCFVSDPYPFASVHAHVRRVVETFGAERCMWGSDVSRLPCTYGEWRRAVTEEMGLCEADLALLMGGALARLLDWPEGPPPR